MYCKILLTGRNGKCLLKYRLLARLEGLSKRRHTANRQFDGSTGSPTAGSLTIWLSNLTGQVTAPWDTLSTTLQQALPNAWEASSWLRRLAVLIELEAGTGDWRWMLPRCSPFLIVLYPTSVFLLISLIVYPSKWRFSISSIFSGVKTWAFFLQGMYDCY